MRRRLRELRLSRYGSARCRQLQPGAAATRSRRSCWVGRPTARSTPCATSASSGRISPAISRTTGSVSPKLTVNLGLRWETTLPPIEEHDRWSDFSPTTPNPGADNRPGALIYAGTGEGRQGSRTLADSWFGGFGPRIGFAYSVNDKTVIRANFARSFSQVTTTTGSTHQKGFTQTFSFGTAARAHADVPVERWTADLPGAAVHLAFLPERRGHAVVAGSGSHPAAGAELLEPVDSAAAHRFAGARRRYNGVAGTHLQAGLLNYNQVPYQYSQQFTQGAARHCASTIRRRPRRSRRSASGCRTRTSENFGNRATVAQALRPYPQYTDINTWDGNGDHSGHSTYHAGVIKLEKRFAHGMSFTTSYVFSKMLTDSDTYWITDNPAPPTSTIGGWRSRSAPTT